MKRLGCAVLVLALGSVGCGSSSDDGTASAGGSGGQPGAGGTGGTGMAGAGASAGTGGGTGGTAGAPATGGAAGMGGVGAMGGAGGAPSGIQAIYSVPDSLADLADDTFFDHPWPSDFRLESDGTIRFVGYPNPRAVQLLEDYKSVMANVIPGFSPTASGFLRFDGAIDPATLPATPLEALNATSSVQLIDVDPGSPELGERKTISLFYRRDAGVYYQSSTLAFMPTLGFPLRGNNKYALVVTDALGGEGGENVVQSPEVRQLLGIDTATGTTASFRDDISSALDAVETAGVPRTSIVHFAVYTTNDPTEETEVIRDWVMANYAAPTAMANGWTATDQRSTFDVYEGMYGPSPDFQMGAIPFQNFGDGGALSFDGAGVPVVEREFDLRFALTVPDETACPPPVGGYPVVLYAHGTGGHYRSFINDGTAASLAAECMAAMGIDQIFHGTRPGSGVGDIRLIFFNVGNPVASRANGPQSAIDVVQQARLFTETQEMVPASVSRTGVDISFDPTNVTFYGHSQGGLNGPMFLAVDDQVRGAVLSGSGSYISNTLLEKTAPIDISALVPIIIALSTPAELAELNVLHPIMSLAQTIVDPTDPAAYVPKILLDPRTGFSPKSIYMTEGVSADFTGDTFTPPRGTEAQAIATGLPPQEVVIHTPEELAWSNLTPVTIPVGGLSGNLAGGQASGVLAQWEATLASDGHFVVFEVPAATAQAAGFLRNLADDPVGRVPAP